MHETLKANFIQNKAAWLALLAVALLLLLGQFLLPAGVVWHSDEGAKLLQLDYLRFDGLLPVANIDYPGRDLDPTLLFAPFHPKQYHINSNGNIRLQWPLFLAVITAPFYALAGMAGLYFWPMLGAIGSCWASWRLALKIGAPRRSAWLTIPLLGLATPLGFYSWLYFEHTLAAFLIAASALALLGGVGSREPAAGRVADSPASVVGGESVARPIVPVNIRSRLPAPGSLLLLASGFLLGLAISLRSELYVLVVVHLVLLIGYRFAQRRKQPTNKAEPTANSQQPTTDNRQPARLPAPSSRLPTPLIWLAGLLLALLPLWIYYAFSGSGVLPYHATWYFAGGEPVGGVSGPRLPEIRFLAQVGWGFIPAFLVGPQNAGGPHVSSLLSAGIVLAPLLALAGGILPWLDRKNAAARLWVVADWLGFGGMALLILCCAPVLLSGEDYGNLHGFLLAAPFVILAALAARPGASRSLLMLAALCVLYIVGHVVVISALSGLGPISTYEWGQRYILPAYPLLIPLAVAALPELVLRSRRYLSPKLGLVCAALLALIGAGFLLRGWFVLDEGKREIASWQAIVAANHDPALLTNDWALPLLLAPEFASHRWYLVSNPDRAQTWLAQIDGGRLPGFALTELNGATLGDLGDLQDQSAGPGGFTLKRYGAK